MSLLPLLALHIYPALDLALISLHPTSPFCQSHLVVGATIKSLSNRCSTCALSIPRSQVPALLDHPTNPPPYSYRSALRYSFEMESMDYNYFAPPVTQPFQFMGFNADNSFPGVNTDGSAHGSVYSAHPV